MKAAVYVRSSTLHQTNFNKIAELNILIQQKGWEVYKVYEDLGYIGSDLNRPAIQQLISDLDNNEFDILLVYKLSDLAHSKALIANLLLKSENITFISKIENIDNSNDIGKQTVHTFIKTFNL